MNKNYEILNSKSYDECTIFYVLYIVLIFVVIFIIYKIIYNFAHSEKFESLSGLEKSMENKFKKDSKDELDKEFGKNNVDKFSNFAKEHGFGDNLSKDVDKLENFAKERGFGDNLSKDIDKLKKMSSNEILTELIDKNKELTNIKNTIQNKLEQQSKAIYISQNYDKVDSSSFNDELMFLLFSFQNTKFPEINLDKKKIIETQSELESVLSEAKNMKNFYKPGDIVSANSTFAIDKNNICYRNDGNPIKPTAEFLQRYPECMVCSVESEQDIYNTNSWKTTKTNINKVCLFNPDAESNSGLPNLNDCQNFCGIKVDKLKIPNNSKLENA